MESLGDVPLLSLDQPSLDATEYIRKASESSSYPTSNAQHQNSGIPDHLNVGKFPQIKNSADSKKIEQSCSFRQYGSSSIVKDPSLGSFYYQNQHDGVHRGIDLHGISNPIADSHQYRAYRARQNDRDNRDEKKWPPDLENYFLDVQYEAMMDVPHMGRHKFTFDGKPHGRNELIALYVWISYKETLPPNVTPDPLMNRHRKQISSHIQVLKKFMRGHCAFDEMFPPADAIQENGYSFDKNPCLVALSQGRLPSKEYRDEVRYKHYRNIRRREGLIRASSYHISSLRPFFFSPASSFPISAHNILSQDIIDSQSSHLYQNYNCGEKLGQGTDIVQLCDDTLESVPQWQEKFPPLLNMLRSSLHEELGCEIIHMQVSLDSLFNYFPSGSAENDVNLKCGFVFNKRSSESASETNSGLYYWRSVNVLTEPREFYGDPSFSSSTATDNHFSGIVVEGNRILISIPARQWAAEILSRQQSSCVFSGERLYCSHHGIKKDDSSGDDNKISSYNISPLIRNCQTDHHFSLSMYQELFTYTTDSNSRHFKRRAIILWSFSHPINLDKSNEPLVSWRYLFLMPKLSSPLPHTAKSSSLDGYTSETTINLVPSFGTSLTTTNNRFNNSSLELLQTFQSDVLAPYNRSTIEIPNAHSDFEYFTTPLPPEIMVPNPKLYQEYCTDPRYHHVPTNCQGINFNPTRNTNETDENNSNNCTFFYTGVEEVNTERVENNLFSYDKNFPGVLNSRIRCSNDDENYCNQNWNDKNHVIRYMSWPQQSYTHNSHEDSVPADDNCLHNHENHDKPNQYKI